MTKLKKYISLCLVLLSAIGCSMILENIDLGLDEKT